MSFSRIQTRHELQHTCTHPGAVETGRTEQQDKDRAYTLIHMKCNRCGMMFGRDLFHDEHPPEEAYE